MQIPSLRNSTKASGLFSPTNEQQRLKSKFWLKYLEDSGSTGDVLSLATVLRYVSHRELGKWWAELVGFPEWFGEHAEYKHKLEYLTNLALDSLEQVLVDKTAAPQARIAAVKVALEAAGKMGKSQAEKYHDEQVGQMSREQLTEFIVRNTRRLMPEKKELTVSLESDTVIKDADTTKP